MSHRTQALYAILAAACLYLVADAFHLTNTAALLDIPISPEAGHVSEGITTVSLRQLDGRRANVRIQYHLDTGRNGNGTLTVAVLDSGNRTVRLAGKLDGLPAGQQSIVLTATRDPAWDTHAFTTGAVRVTLGDQEGNVIDHRIFNNHSLAWSPLRDKSYSTVPASMETARYQLWSLMNNGDYSALDQLCNTWRSEHTLTADGWPALHAFQALPATRSIRDNWRHSLDEIQAWKSSAASDCAAITEAQLWSRLAWYERGSARWDELSDTAIRIFRDKLATARILLEEQRETLSDNPLWHVLYMDLLIEQGSDRESVLKVFIDAVRLDNRYHPAYATAAYAYFPQWGGSYRAMEQFIQNALGTVDESERGLLYLHIYSTLDSYLDPEVGLFRDTYASWPLMKTGFDTLLDRYPDNDTLLNRYASYSCRAGDEKTYLGIRQRLDGSRIQHGAWRHNHTPDTCDHTFMKRL